MITSEKQYEAAKEQLQMLSQSLLSPLKNDVPIAIAEAAKSQIQGLINEIKKIWMNIGRVDNCPPAYVPRLVRGIQEMLRLKIKLN